MERLATVLERSELLPMDCEPPPMGCRTPLDLVMANVAKMMKRSALVMKT